MEHPEEACCQTRKDQSNHRKMNIGVYRETDDDQDSGVTTTVVSSLDHILISQPQELTYHITQFHSIYDPAYIRPNPKAGNEHMLYIFMPFHMISCQKLTGIDILCHMSSVWQKRVLHLQS